MQLIPGAIRERAVVLRKTPDNAVLEVNPESGGSLLLHLPGLGVAPFSVSVGDSVMLTRYKSAIHNVERL